MLNWLDESSQDKKEGKIISLKRSGRNNDKLDLPLDALGSNNKCV